MTNPLHAGLARWLTVSLAVTLIAPAAARAQDRPFLFSITTATDASTPGLRLDVGAGERAFQSGTDNQPEQRVTVQASHGRFTAIGRVGVVSLGSAYQSSQSGELLVSLVSPSPGFTLAAGGGALREAAGTDVLMARTSAAAKPARGTCTAT